VKITILAVGKLKERYWKEALAQYVQRLCAYGRTEIIELSDREGQKSTAEHVQIAEGADILKRLAAGAANSHVVALDSQGTNYSSEQLSRRLDDLKLSGKSNIVFIIGGSHGLSKEVLSQAHESLSFGAQTWPHQMARVMLAEQLYRACSISANHPYHK